MNRNWFIVGLVVLFVAAGGYFYLSQDAAKDAMAKDEATEKKDSMEKDTTKNEVMTNDALKNDDVMQKDEMMKDEGAMEKGSYEDYAPEKLALAKNGKVVLYFHADWCPLCRPLNAEFKAKESTLSGVHILKVNYDTATALKQKYGVTYQHTFVQVDAQGNLVKKWGDATSLASVLAKVQ